MIFKSYITGAKTSNNASTIKRASSANKYPVYMERNDLDCGLGYINLDRDTEDVPFTQGMHCSRKQSASHCCSLF